MHNHRRGFSFGNDQFYAGGDRPLHKTWPSDRSRRSGRGGALIAVSRFRLRLMFNFIQIPSANEYMLDFRGAGSKRLGFEFSYLTGTR